jgi:glycosyltransferase involved in cell wall biosynthesis
MPDWVYKYKSDNMEVLDEIIQPLVYQEDKTIMIVPLLSGSGIRAKIIEGLALGKTIISTSIGAQGIDCESGKNILIADSPEEFSAHIIRCVNDPDLCRRLGENARKLSQEHYQSSATTKKMLEFYKLLTKANG